MKGETAMAEGSYLMESAQEAARLEAKTSLEDARAQLDLVGLQPGARALDVGTGSGAAARVMAELVTPSGQVIAIDASPARVEAARALAGADSPPHLTFQVGDIFHLPPSCRDADLVWCRFVFEYLTRQAEALASLARAARPGGKVVVADIDGFGLYHDNLPATLAADLQRVHGALEGRFDPHAGRRLFGLFHRQGLQEIRVHMLPYHFYAGRAPAVALANWRHRFATLRPLLLTALGDAARVDDFVGRYLDFLGDRGTFSYSVLFVAEGLTPSLHR